MLVYAPPQDAVCSHIFGTTELFPKGYEVLSSLCILEIFHAETLLNSVTDPCIRVSNLPTFIWGKG
jgi:hypothetical protein